MKKIDLYLWEFLLFVLVGINMVTMIGMAVFNYQGHLLAMYIILLNMCYLVGIYSLYSKQYVRRLREK